MNNKKNSGLPKGSPLKTTVSTQLQKAFGNGGKTATVAKSPTNITTKKTGGCNVCGRKG